MVGMSTSPQNPIEPAPASGPAPATVPARGPLARWWHARRPWQRRTVRQTAVVVATGVVALTIGVFTATAEGSVGPHEADLAITSTHEIDIDLGPLGALLLDSPAPWPIGVQVDVGEIPATLTEVDNPLDALGGDVSAYAAFFAQPEGAITAAVWALVSDAVARTVLLWSIALVVIAVGQLAAGGLLRAELRAKLHRRGVAPLVAVTVLAVVAVPVAGIAQRPLEQGRESQVLAELGGAMSGARVTGRLGVLIDTYGERAIATVRSNDTYYDVVRENVVAAYAADDAPLEPRRPLAPLVVEEPEPEAEVDADAEVDAGTRADADASPSDDASTSTDAARSTDVGTDDVTGTDEATGSDDATADDADTDATNDATPTSTPTRATRDEAEPDLVTMVLISDNHCNTGMGRVMGEVARQAQADVVLNLGDTTMGGSGPEQLCVDAIADELTDFPVVVADGNHDSMLTGEQERQRGWTVLDGGVVEVEGVRIVGDRDPRLTSVTLGKQEFATKAEAATTLTDAACAGFDPDDPASRVDILAIHDPYVGNRVMPSGCIVLELSGHLHRRVGPFQQGLGLFYGMASSGGATAGQLTLGTLPARATISVLLYDRANRRPAALREVRIDPDQAVTLTPWEAFPEMPTTSVEADLSPAASD